MSFQIRDAEAGDGAIIADFNNRLAEETESYSLDPEKIGPGVAAMLADPSKGRYWVATAGDDVIGQIAISYEWSDWRNGMFWWIESVYVHAEHRRKGVYSSLYKHVENLARDDDHVIGLRLYVEHDNERAQNTYNKLGMAMTSYKIMETLLD